MLATELKLCKINEISKISKQESGLMVVSGRRRIGKTTVIKRALRETMIFYSQALEAAEKTQVEQVKEDIRPLHPDVPIESWIDFIKPLYRAQPTTLVLDEFSYLVKTQPALPSIIQKWLDHDCPEGMKLILSGSSQTMMHDIFKSGSSPLYERAGGIIHLKPISYRYFCEAKGLDSFQEASYLFYALVGGVPKYWEFLKVESDRLEEAQRLYLESGSRLEYEPERLLKGENIIVGPEKPYLFSILNKKQ